MSIRRGTVMVAIAVIAITVVVLIAYAVTNARPQADGYTGHAASPTPSASGADGAEANTPSSTASSSTASSSSSSSSSTSSTASAGSGDHPTWDPAQDAEDGADSQPKVPGGEGAEPYRLPEVSERRPALSALPGEDVAEGALAKGFPEDIIPVPEAATVQSSSVSAQGRRVLVGLEALSDDDPQAVLDVYAARCTDLGWAVTIAPDTTGHERLQCGYHDDSMTVDARRLPTGRVGLTVTGVFLVAEGS